MVFHRLLSFVKEYFHWPTIIVGQWKYSFRTTGCLVNTEHGVWVNSFIFIFGPQIESRSVGALSGQYLSIKKFLFQNYQDPSWDIGDRLPQKGLIVFNGKACQYRTLIGTAMHDDVNGYKNGWHFNPCLDEPYCMSIGTFTKLFRYVTIHLIAHDCLHSLWTKLASKRLEILFCNFHQAFIW